MASEIQLTPAINFTSSKDTGEEREMYTTSDNVKFTSYDDINDVAKKLFQSLLSRSRDDLETSVRGSDFYSVELMYFKRHRVTLNVVDHTLIPQDGWKTKKKW